MTPRGSPVHVLPRPALHQQQRKYFRRRRDDPPLHHAAREHVLQHDIPLCVSVGAYSYASLPSPVPVLPPMYLEVSMLNRTHIAVSFSFFVFLSFQPSPPPLLLPYLTHSSLPPSLHSGFILIFLLLLRFFILVQAFILVALYVVCVHTYIHIYIYVSFSFISERTPQFISFPFLCSQSHSVTHTHTAIAPSLHSFFKIQQERGGGGLLSQNPIRKKKKKKNERLWSTGDGVCPSLASLEARRTTTVAPTQSMQEGGGGGGRGMK